MVLSTHCVRSQFSWWWWGLERPQGGKGGVTPDRRSHSSTALWLRLLATRGRRPISHARVLCPPQAVLLARLGARAASGELLLPVAIALTWLLAGDSEE